jgi:hypothetical protein
MKLFHQRVAGDWTEVIAEIGDELKRRVREELQDADCSDRKPMGPAGFAHI